MARSTKFRQAAFVYLHVGILYEAIVWVLWRSGSIPASRGGAAVWLAFGVVIVALVFWGLYWWQKPWFARVVWGLHLLRLPAILERAFLPASDARLPPSLYLTALIVVLINLWMLARAGWDL